MVRVGLAIDRLSAELDAADLLLTELVRDWLAYTLAVRVSAG